MAGIHQRPESHTPMPMLTEARIRASRPKARRYKVSMSAGCSCSLPFPAESCGASAIGSVG
jgi:hypothetical protein